MLAAIAVELAAGPTGWQVATQSMALVLVRLNSTGAVEEETKALAGWKRRKSEEVEVEAEVEILAGTVVVVVTLAEVAGPE